MKHGRDSDETTRESVNWARWNKSECRWRHFSPERLHRHLHQRNVCGHHVVEVNLINDKRRMQNENSNNIQQPCHEPSQIDNKTTRTANRNKMIEQRDENEAKRRFENIIWKKYMNESGKNEHTGITYSMQYLWVPSSDWRKRPSYELRTHLAMDVVRCAGNSIWYDVNAMLIIND